MQSADTPVKPGMFQSKLLPAAAVILTLSAILGMVSTVLLLDQTYRQVLQEKLILSGILSQSSILTWTIINTAITVASFLCPATAALGLWIILRKNAVGGLNNLYTASHWLLYGVHGIAATALAILIFRVIRYTLFARKQNEGLYLIYAMLLMESMMVALAWFLYHSLVKFLNSLCDATASIAYTLSSGKVNPSPIPAFASTGFFWLGIICLGLSIDRTFTITIIQSFTGDYYKLLMPTHWGQYLSAAALVASAVGNFLLCIYLRQYKRICETALFENRIRITQ